MDFFDYVQYNNIMFGNPKEYNSKFDKTLKIKLAKFFYRVFDAILLRSSFPLIGKINNKIRVFWARKISKGISKKAFIEKGAFISTGIVVDDFGSIGFNCKLDWGVHIGKHVMMGPNVYFFTRGHLFDVATKSFVSHTYTEPRPIYIGDNCWLGYSAIILGNVNIGNGCTVGAGSVVTKSFNECVLIAGNPAVQKKYYLNDSK